MSFATSGRRSNDTAGDAALATLGNVPLPAHFRTMTLPPNAVAGDYPTREPQGPGRMDVNRMACGMEMYLGVEALCDPAGELLPIRWTGYNAKLGCYQCVVQDKDGIAGRFLDQLATCAGPAEASARFPELREVVDAITGQFSEVGPRHRQPRENLSD